MSKKMETFEHVEQVYSGDLHWYSDDLRIICCHCGLTHKYKMGIGYKNGKPEIWFRVWEMNDETKRYRLSEKIYVDVEKRVKRKK